jgi:fatty-acyl-CoA synthase
MTELTADSPGSYESVLETTVGGVLREAAERAAGTAALVEGTADRRERRRWSYADLLADSERVACALLGRFAPGERVAVWSPNCPEWLLLEFGAALAGLTLVTVNPALRAREVAHVLGQSRAHGLVLAPAYRGADLTETLAQVRGGLPGLREVISLVDWDAFVGSGSATERLPDVGPDDEAQIQYTSGTTGVPKGAVLRHRGITNSARFCAQILQAEPGEVWVNPMPLFHTAGCVLLTLGPVQGLFTQVLVPGFEPGLVLNLIESERSALIGGVPTMLLAQLGHPGFSSTDLSAVRCAIAGGATVPPTVVQRVESALGVPFSITFAQTEASPCITQTRLDDSPADRAYTLGRPHPHVEVMIADPATGEPVPAGTVGEILTRGYHVMKGYFDDPGATSDAIDAAGWLHTGDLGSADERGYYRIEGRLKEMIIRGGENIYPREIEQVLYTHPGVADVAVVGVPDDHWGEQVAAFIRPAPGQTPTDEALAVYCRTHLAAHKVPRHWVFIDAFPLTGSGKVQKYLLREQFNSGQAPALPAWGPPCHFPDPMQMPRVHRGGRRETWSDGRKIATLPCQYGRSGITRPMEAAHGYRHDD